MKTMQWLFYSTIALIFLSGWNKTILPLVQGASACKVHIKNDSGQIAAIKWVDPKTKEAIHFSQVGVGSSFTVDTYYGHQFQFVEMPNDKTKTCQDPNACKVGSFTVPQQIQEMHNVLTPDFDVISEDELLGEVEMPEDIAEYCKAWAQEKLKEEANGDATTKKSILDQVGECIKKGMAYKLVTLQDENEFERRVRETISSKMENFTCLDPELGTSPDVDLREWTSEKDHVTRLVHVKLDRPASRIHVVEHFASPEECDAMETVAAPKLHDASVADGKGGIKYSENRKAKQAGITPDFSKEADGDLVAILSRRVYDYTNFVLDMNITEHGQEPLMSIQYFGRGYDDGEPDRYTPHCDGRCDGLQHDYGTRMATMVIYCKIPEKGGHTNFQNAGVHIKPEIGSAIFFSYIDPKTNLTDKALTQHSGCPVYEGEKKIITQWVRYGVNDRERSHYHFNTLGILHAESGDN